MAQELPERTVTVVSTEVGGSTDLTTRQGDEAAQETTMMPPEDFEAIAESAAEKRSNASRQAWWPVAAPAICRTSVQTITVLRSHILELPKWVIRP